MGSTITKRRDLSFLLYEVFDVLTLTEKKRYADHDRETLEAVLDTAQKIAEDHFLPHASAVDEEEPTFENGIVSMRPEVKQALDHYYEAGFLAAPHEYAMGGMQLPHMVSTAIKGIFTAANVGTTAYPFLSGANVNVIKNFGTDEQKRLFMEPQLTGQFMGTMALTEPQAGSSLSDIKTIAAPQKDGSYRLTGNKIFISAGDHELAENIIHLVLARIKDAPPGVKGISLFIVPKFLVNEDGGLGDRNDVALAGLIHKMGYRGTTSTMLNFGEKDGAVGYLVGEPHKGLGYMFQMMNEARIGVGVGAVVLGYSGYLNALEYAKERPQGRHAQNKDPNDPQIRIIEHTDVKRMLLASKSYVEGGLALALYASKLVDRLETAATEAEEEKNHLLLEILTPIVKSWPSVYCLEANALAIQVLGGYGYTREYPVERLYRDNRLNPIHEGTHGIQSLDLLGRKVTMKNGAAFKLLSAEIMKTVVVAQTIDQTKSFAETLEDALGQISQTTQTLTDEAAKGNIDLFLANSAVYLDVFGHLVVAWIWLQQGITAANAEANSAEEEAFYRGKLQACQYFFRWELPKIAQGCHLLQRFDETCLAMQEEWF